MGPVRVFPSIPVPLPHGRILARLGYNRHRTVLHAHHESLVETSLRIAYGLCVPQGAVRRVAIASLEGGTVRLGTGDVFRSASLAAFLSGSREALLLAATVGPEIVRAVNREIAAEHASRAAIYDAVASETVDAALGWLQDYVQGQAARERAAVTKHRYSPGYGDLGLDAQATVFRLLELERLGLTLTPRRMLVPEKSVIGIAGIETAGS
jgi:hypothetical protein